MRDGEVVHQNERRQFVIFFIAFFVCVVARGVWNWLGLASIGQGEGRGSGEGGRVIYLRDCLVELVKGEKSMTTNVGETFSLLLYLLLTTNSL